MTAFDSNSTSADNQMEVIVANNTTVETGNSSNVNQTDSEPSNVLQQPHNASEYNMTMFGVSSDCAVIVKNCYEQNASDEFEQFLYCEAFEKSSQCVAENITSGNDTMMCSGPDLKILEASSCSPSNMGLNVPPQCKARITQCGTPYVTPAEKMAGIDNKLFESKICITLENEGCLNVENDGAVCSASEIAIIENEVLCSGSARLLSGVLLLALMLVVTRVM
ncbi:hypothetical protein RRG08_041606 [Elysia crispata]|uniref:Uncharacterized protein n=1 Tax=Elysia crispata TaxID=231223 RepID=A0AAE1E715_9GAST|nr:hypothetical protein RRG08_041606 [Elysia crispata]